MVVNAGSGWSMDTAELNEIIYRALFEQTNDAVFIIGLDFNYLNVNDQAARLLGYSREELIGKSVNEITSLEEVVDSDESSSGIETFNKVYERMLIRKDGSKIPVEISTAIVYNLDGSPSHIQSTARDISSRKDYEERLRKSEERNKAIVDALPDLIFRLDRQGRIIDFSAAADHPLYLPRAEVLDCPIQDVWPDLFSQVILAEIEKAFETKTIQVAKLKFQGREETYEVRLNPVTQNEIFGILRDISEWVQLEQMKSDFINRASHELRTPLTTSLLMTDLIDEGGTEEELVEFWSVLKHELNRQKILVDRLLMAGRLESNTLAIDLMPVMLPSIISESAAAVAPIAKKNNIQIETVFSEDLPQVIGDVSALQQVFINLLNNAVKFSPEGSTVICSAKPEADGVTVRISDQGIGIPEGEIPNLFERFFRTRSVKAAEIPGSGIGLFIVKSIVEEVGGKIWVDSEVDCGTTFVVWLQAAVG